MRARAKPCHVFFGIMRVVEYRSFRPHRGGTQGCGEEEGGYYATVVLVLDVLMGEERAPVSWKQPFFVVVAILFFCAVSGSPAFGSPPARPPAAFFFVFLPAAPLVARPAVMTYRSTWFSPNRRHDMTWQSGVIER